MQVSLYYSPFQFKHVRSALLFVLLLCFDYIEEINATILAKVGMHL